MAAITPSFIVHKATLRLWVQALQGLCLTLKSMRAGFYSRPSDVRPQVILYSEDISLMPSETEFQFDVYPPLYTRSWQSSLDAKRTIGIIHGLGEHSGRYGLVADFFTNHASRVMSYDQRGHGNSPGVRGDAAYADLLADIDSFVQKLKSFDQPVFLYGQSLGGNLVLNYALRYQPELAGIVAMSPLLLPSKKTPLWLQLVGRALAILWPSFTFRTAITAAKLTRDPQQQAELRKDPLRFDFVTARLAVRMLDAGRWALDHAHELQTPTLLMHGSTDQITSAESSRQFATRAGQLCQLKIWPDMQHELHFELDRVAVLADVQGWLEKQTRPAPED